MASGKKSKKTKGKTLALTDFLQETTGSIPIQPIRKSNLNWADEVEDYDDRKTVNVVLPTAPKASRDYDDITDKVPTEPPFCAYLSNLPYDVDEEEIAAFFSNMRISSMRIPKDDRGGEKSKGYGYIEFEDRDSLLDALVMRDTTLKSRRMRIEVASNMDNDRRRGGRMDMNRDRQSDRSDSFGDWRSGPRAAAENVDDRRSGFNRDRDRDGGGGGGFTREGMRDKDDRSFTREGMRDRDNNRDFGRDKDGSRDFTRDRDSNRDSYRKDKDDDKPGGWRDGDRSNKDDRDRGFNRDRGNFRDSDRGSRFEDRDDRRGGGGGFGGRRFDDRRDDRDGGRRDERDGGRRDDRDRDRRDGGGFSRRDDKDSEPASSEGRERPKLMLAPRTKPVEIVPVNTESVPSASIFGSAKPVDTSQREREIEEKLARGSDKPRDSSKDRDKERKPEDIERSTTDVENLQGDKLEKSRPSRKIEDNPYKDRDSRDGPPKKSFDDRKLPPKNDHKSPDKSDNRHKYDKSEKPLKREEKRERQEKDMPKLTEQEPPNFAANNKFAFLPTDSD